MANKRSIYMEGTTRTAQACCAEITATLARVPGVREVGQSLNGGAVAAIRFTVELNGVVLSFLLKPNLDGVKNQYRRFHSKAIDDRKAGQIAWAQLAEFVKVQSSMIEGGQSSVIDAFLSRLEAGDGSTTISQWFLGGGYKQLAAPQEGR